MQFAAWSAQCASVIEMRENLSGSRGYAAGHSVWQLGAMALSQVRAPGATFRRTASHIRRDSLDHWIVSYTRRGTQALRIDDACMAAPARVPCIFSLREPFEGRRDTIDWVTLFVSRDLFPDLAPAIDAAMHRPLDTAMGGLLGGYLDMLAGQLPRMTLAELPRAVEATRAMFAACIAPTPDARAAAQEQIAQTRLARLKALVRQNLRSPTLGPRRLCGLGGVSRSQLYRLFEPFGGVARYIQAERLQHAHRALSDPCETRDIQRIAEEFGFYDASTFSRIFRREFGMTPTELRRAALVGHRAAPRRPGAAAAPRFADILRAL